MRGEPLERSQAPAQPPAVPLSRNKRCRAFTLVELLIAVAIILTLSALAIPKLTAALELSKTARAVAEIRSLQSEIAMYEIQTGTLPPDLNAIGRGNLLDPWGSPYVYFNFSAGGKGAKGKARKDRFLVPINSTYDLYSMGKDGQSQAPLTAKASRDDIVRANDGAFIGPASQF